MGGRKCGFCSQLCRCDFSKAVPQFPPAVKWRSCLHHRAELRDLSSSLDGRSKVQSLLRKPPQLTVQTLRSQRSPETGPKHFLLRPQPISKEICLRHSSSCSHHPLSHCPCSRRGLEVSRLRRAKKSSSIGLLTDGHLLPARGGNGSKRKRMRSWKEDSSPVAVFLATSCEAAGTGRCQRQAAG